MAVTIWLLGLADIYLTKYGLQLGVISEGNPIMAYFFSIHPNVAVLFSLGISGILLYCLHLLTSRTAFAVKALWALLAIRLFVIFLHANWLVQVISWQKIR